VHAIFTKFLNSFTLPGMVFMGIFNEYKIFCKEKSATGIAYQFIIFANFRW